MIIDKDRILLNSRVLHEINSETNLSFISNITETKLNKMLMLGYDIREIFIFGITNNTEKRLYKIQKGKDLILASNKQFTVEENADEIFAGFSFISINLNNIDTSNVEILESAFRSSIAKEINLENIDTSNVRNMKETFKSSNVRELDLSNLDLSNVYTMTSLFESSNIKKLNMKNNSTSGIKYYQQAFSGCHITELNLEINIAEGACMDLMFAGSTIERLNINFKNPTNIKSVYNMFRGSTIRELDLNKLRLNDALSDSDAREMFRQAQVGILYAADPMLRQAYADRYKF